MNKKISQSHNGFTLMEVLMYIFITSLLLVIVGSIVVNIINVRKNLVASNLVYGDARFIMNYLSNNIHNVDLIDDVIPAPEKLHFYQLPEYRFSLEVVGDDLVYRQVEDTGGGFPDQSTADPIMLNSQETVVSDFVMKAYDDDEGNSNIGVSISFVLTVGSPGNSAGYLSREFSTFLSLR